MKRLFVIFSGISMLFSGCMKKAPAVENWIVISNISVIREYQGLQTQRNYSQQDKMEQILNALRSLGTESTPEVDPESLNLRSYTITLTHTDGSKKIYQTKGDRYIRRGNGPWQQADPKKVAELNFLLQSLPGDTPDIRRREGG